MPNAKVPPPGRPGGRNAPERRHAGPVGCNGWIHLMASLATGRTRPNGKRDHGKPGPTVDLSADACARQPRSGIRPARRQGGHQMRVYTTPHSHYCGVDLHARSLFVHVLDHAGTTRLERDIPASPAAFLDAIGPYRDGLV